MSLIGYCAVGVAPAAVDKVQDAVVAVGGAAATNPALGLAAVVFALNAATSSRTRSDNVAWM